MNQSRDKENRKVETRRQKYEDRQIRHIETYGQAVKRKERQKEKEDK